MDKTTRLIIVLGFFGIIILLLYGIKKLFLDKIGNPVLKYISAMTAVYTILIVFNIISIENRFIRSAFQRTRLYLAAGKVMEPGFILLALPAFYSIFFIGHFKKGLSAKEEWDLKKRLMLSVFINGFFPFVLLMCFNYLYNGHSLSELFALIKASTEYIDWKFIPPFIGLIVLFVHIMKREHFKHK